MIALPLLLPSLCSAEPRDGVIGKVMNEMGEPISECKVTLYYHRRWTGFQNTIVATANTADDGSFIFDDKLVFYGEPHGSYVDYYEVLAQQPDYSFGWHLIMRDDPTGEIRILLGPPTAQSFVVRDEDGRPISDVQVWLRYAGHRESPKLHYRSPSMTDSEWRQSVTVDQVLASCSALATAR
jgi:hypothetical protein